MDSDSRVRHLAWEEVEKKALKDSGEAFAATGLSTKATTVMRIAPRRNDTINRLRRILR